MNLKKKEVLSDLSFGNQVAEEETETLETYFLQTNSWKRIYRGEVDIIYGAKGTGKSAIYVLIQKHEDEFKKKGIILVPAEEVRGDPVFSNLKSDTPASEREFENLWKLYFLSLVGRTLDQQKIANKDADKVIASLRDSGLLPSEGMTLAGVLKSVLEYARKLINPKAAEVTLEQGGQITWRIVFDEPSSDNRLKGHVSVTELLHLSNSALRSSKKKVWLLIDRLDVAFYESPTLERNALRSLFQAYKTLRKYDNILLKIFLRTDIWDRISDAGFREATHLTRDLTLTWDTPALQNLILRRLISNSSIIRAYKISKSKVLESVDEQNSLFYRVFPPQVEPGQRQSSTMDWLIKRTVDGKGKSTPRELILFLNTLREKQLQRLERGEPEPPVDYLFDGKSFKQALPEISGYRTVRVLYAEYPDLKSSIEALRGKKAEQKITSLMEAWSKSEPDALEEAHKLVEVGFFEKRQAGRNITFWVPFIYRPYLELIMGRVKDIAASAA